jgi:hypothetical protein
MPSFNFSLIESASTDQLLTKTAEYDAENGGSLQIKSATQLYSGTVKQYALNSTEELPNFYHMCRGLTPHQAITLGVTDAPVTPLVTKKHFVQGTNVARTLKCFTFPAEGLMLFDIDSGDYTPEELHGILISAVPELRGVAFIAWESTSSQIYHSDGRCLRGNHGYHCFIPVEKVRGNHTFEKIRNYLEFRCWQAGHGFIEVSAAGSMLKRSILDLSVFSPERLVYEAAPVLAPELIQKRTTQPYYVPGHALNTELVPEIGPTEERILYNLIREASQKPEIKEQAARVRSLRKESYIREHRDIDRNRAGNMFERLTKAGNLIGPGRIYPHMESLRAEDIPSLHLSADSEGARPFFKVSQALNSPDLYAGIACHDPMEPEYNNWSQTATVLLDDMGRNPFIASFAHGKKTYRLKWDLESLLNALYALNHHEMSAAAVTQSWQRLVRNFDGEEEDYHAIAGALKDFLGVKTTKSKLLSLVTTGEDENMTPALMAERLASKYGDSVVFLDDEIVPTYLFYHSTGVDAGTWTTIPKLRFEKWIQDDIHELRGISFNDRMVVDTQKILSRNILMSSSDFSNTEGVSKDLITFNNGVYDLRKEEFVRGHSREHKARWKLPYNWAPGTECPMFLALLRGMFDQEGVDIFRAALKGVMTNRSDLQYYLEMYGAAGAGKSTAISILTLIVGARNTYTSKLSVLETNQFEPLNVVDMKLVLFPDEEQYHSKCDVFKSMVGNDTMRLERKNKQGEPGKNGRQFAGVAVVIANEPLFSPDKSGAIERRRRALMCHKFWTGKPDPSLAKKTFAAEGPQIFNWIMQMKEDDMVRALMNKQDEHSMAHHREAIPIFMFLEDSLTASAGGKVIIGSGFGMEGERTLFSECRTYNEGNEGTIRAFSNPRSFRRMLDQALPMLFPEAQVRRQGTAKKAFVEGIAWKSELAGLTNFKLIKKPKTPLFLQNVQTAYKVNRDDIPQLLRFLWGEDDEAPLVTIDVNLEQRGIDPDKVVESFKNTWEDYSFDGDGIEIMKERVKKAVKKLDFL